MSRTKEIKVKFLTANKKQLALTFISTYELRSLGTIICREITRRGGKESSTIESNGSSKTNITMVFTSGKSKLLIEDVPVAYLEDLLGNLCRIVGERGAAKANSTDSQPHNQA